MARIQPVIQIELDPSQPVSEICAVISAVMAYHTGAEFKVLEGVRKAITDQLEKLKGDEQDAEL